MCLNFHWEYIPISCVSKVTLEILLRITFQNSGNEKIQTHTKTHTAARYLLLTAPMPDQWLTVQIHTFLYVRWPHPHQWDGIHIDLQNPNPNPKLYSNFVFSSDHGARCFVVLLLWPLPIPRTAVTGIPITVWHVYGGVIQGREEHDPPRCNLMERLMMTWPLEPSVARSR